MNKIPMRDGYGKALLKLIGGGKPVVALDADVAKSTRTNWIKDKFPEKFLDMGISEQDMVGTAAGCIPIVGFNMGAGKKARVRELFWKLPGTEAAAGAVGFALLLPRFWGLEGVLLSMPVSDALTFAAAVCLIRRTDRQLRIKEERTP